MGTHEALGVTNDVAPNPRQLDNNTGEFIMALEVTLVTDLGPNNAGNLGPADEAEIAESTTLINDLARPEYSLPASNKWICVDGRSSQEEIENAGNKETADPQIGGSTPISETAASYMDEPATHDPLSKVVADKTRSAVDDGQVVALHGDTKAEKAGCKANAAMREVLRFMVANADVVMPTVWQLVEVAGVSDSLEKDDLSRAVVNANTAVEDDALWDITPEEVVDVAVANGADYMVLQGPHNEIITRADMSTGAFAKAAFVRDHTTADKSPQAFSASLGAYTQEALRRGELHGQSRRETALLIARVFMYNIALTKLLKNDEMLVGVLSPAS